jgi:hypothetical protein
MQSLQTWGLVLNWLQVVRMELFFHFKIGTGILETHGYGGGVEDHLG